MLLSLVFFKKGLSTVRHHVTFDDSDDEYEDVPALAAKKESDDAGLGIVIGGDIGKKAEMEEENIALDNSVSDLDVSISNRGNHIYIYIYI